MTPRVHAFLVVRPDGRQTGAWLQRTLDALAAQTRAVNALTIVLCGADRETTDAAAASGAEGIITASPSTSFAEALRLASARLNGDSVWLLAHDTAPAPEALERLTGAFELAESVAVAAPKLVGGDDPERIVSLGTTMTRLGRAVPLVADELDQGQHDTKQDVLGADVRGLLVRADLWGELAGIDPGLGGADEGLDLGVRARLAGRGVRVVPTAVVAVAGAQAGFPASPTRRQLRRMAHADRRAQLHRRLSYAPAAAVPLHWLSLIPLSLWHAAALLVAKRPARVLPEWGAAIVVFFRLGAVARARGVIRRVRRASWKDLEPLRIRRAELRQRLDGDDDEASGAAIRDELRFFTGGGAWIVLAALAVSLIAFPALLAWPVLGGGGLVPLHSTFAQLWADAAYGARSLGLDTVGPADPFAAVVAVLGSLWPGDPSRALVLLWLGALPLAVLGGWFAATRLTGNSLLRATAAVAWALAPTFWSALIEGRPAAVLVHLLLPWLFYAGSIAHRSWAAAGAASVLLAAVLACAPSLAPALVALWAIVVILVVIVKAGRGVGRVVWVLVPAIALSAPLVWAQLRAGNPWGLLADPGVVWQGTQAPADAAGRLALASGFPSGDLGGWVGLLGGTAFAPLAGWVVVLIAPLGVLALLSLLTPRWMVAAVPLVVTALGLTTAVVAVGIAVSFTNDAQPVALWPGAGLSLAWLGVVAAAVIALDAGVGDRLRNLRTVGAILVIATLAVVAVPALTAGLRGTALLQNGPVSTLPAYVAAQGRDDTSVATVVLTPLPSGAVASRVVWGGSETLGGQSTLAATRIAPGEGDAALAALTADLVGTTSKDAVARAAAAGIEFIVLAPAATNETDAARSLRLQAVTALNQRDGLENAGATPKGTLWHVTEAVTHRAAESDRHLTALIAVLQLLVVVIALLLSVPTAASRRAARRTTRTVGPRARKELP